MAAENKKEAAAAAAAAADLPTETHSEMGTMFILDLLRQRREKLMRLKKDELINEMARKQREKMALVSFKRGFKCT